MESFKQFTNLIMAFLYMWLDLNLNEKCITRNFPMPSKAFSKAKQVLATNYHPYLRNAFDEIILISKLLPILFIRRFLLWSVENIMPFVCNEWPIIKYMTSYFIGSKTDQNRLSSEWLTLPNIHFMSYAVWFTHFRIALLYQYAGNWCVFT